MQLTDETFGKLQSRLDDLASQAVGPLREQVATLSLLLTGLTNNQGSFHA